MADAPAPRHEVPLATLTSLRIGGPAEHLVVAGHARELSAALSWAAERALPWRVLGPGTNCLVGDRGLRGLVVVAQGGDVTWEASAVWADAGVRLAKVARLAAERGLSGLEWAEGIPGSLGGAVVQNAGAYGGETAERVLLAEVLHVSSGAREHWTATDCGFSYRSSRLRPRAAPEQAPREHVVLRVRLRLDAGEPAAIKERMRDLQAQRRAAQPNSPRSVGSTFKNPPPPHPPAGVLIDTAGLKGSRVGQAQISPRHANFFINLGGATAAEVRELIARAQEEVWKRHGVRLEPEVEFVGAF